jgi:hypothetical protein
VGGSIVWKTRDIGLPSYSNNLSTLRRINLPHQIAGLRTFEDKVGGIPEKQKVHLNILNYRELKSRKFCIFLSFLYVERLVKETHAEGPFVVKFLQEAACDSVKSYLKLGVGRLILAHFPCSQ